MVKEGADDDDDDLEEEDCLELRTIISKSREGLLG